jgi:hypothetical protein
LRPSPESSGKREAVHTRRGAETSKIGSVTRTGATKEGRVMADARVFVEGNNSIVRVQVGAETLYNLEETQGLTRSILGRLGCPGCHSGLQILFQLAEQEFAAD